MSTATERSASVASPASGTRARRTAGVAWARWALVAVVALGWALRIREYAFGRSLWADEVGVVTDFEHGSYGSLRHVLPNGQAAPLGWLWASKAIGSWFGYSDYGVRVVPFVASLASVVLFAYVARRLLGPWAALVATIPFATAPRLIYYASEAKQYSSDVALTLAVIALTIRVWGRPSRRAAAGWAVAASLIVWCSQPGIVVVVICGLLLAARWVPDRRSLGITVAALALPIIMIVLDYVLQLRAQQHAPLFQRAWRAGYPPKPETVGGTLGWIPSDFASVAQNPGRIDLPALLFAMMLIGALVAGWRRRDRWGVVLLAAPLVVALAMAVVRLYPLRERLALYLLAPVFLLACAAVGVVGRGHTPRARTAALVLATAAVVADGVVFAPSVRAGTAVLAHPIDHSSGRQELQQLAQGYRPGDQIYVESPWAGQVYDYYAPRFPQLPHPASFSFAWTSGACDDAATLSRLRPGERVWVYFDQRDAGVLLHPDAAPPPADSAQYYLSYFLSRGQLVERYRRPRAQGELDLVRITGHGPPPMTSWMSGTCFTFG